MKSKRGKELKTGFVLIMIACLLFINGCWGKREVEELAFLIGVGIDLGQQPGTYLVTYQFTIPEKGTTGPNIKTQTLSIESLTARGANEKVFKVSSRKIFMGSLRVLVIGEDAAKAGFLERTDFEQRFSEFRPSMYLVLTKGKAQSILNLSMRAGQSPAINIKQNLDTSNTLSTPVINFGQYLNVLSRESTAPIIPLIHSIKSGDGDLEYKAEVKNEAEYIQSEGAGVFRGDRLVNFLTDKETKGYMWLENKVRQRLINTEGSEDSKVNLGGQVLKSTTKYKVTVKDGTIGLQYQIKATIALEEVMGLTEKLSEPGWVDFMKEVEKSFAKLIQKECELSIQKEKELGLDFLGIGRHIEQHNPGYWKTVKDQWDQKIADFPVSLNVEVKINHSGMASSSPTTNSWGEGEE